MKVVVESRYGRAYIPKDCLHNGHLPDYGDVWVMFEIEGEDGSVQRDVLEAIVNSNGCDIEALSAWQELKLWANAGAVTFTFGDNEQSLLTQ